MKCFLFVLGFFCIVASVLANLHAERTLIIMKPDGIERGLIGEVMSRFEMKEYKLVAIKLVMVSIEDKIFGEMFVVECFN